MADYSDSKSLGAYTATYRPPRMVGGYRLNPAPPYLTFQYAQKPSAWHRFWTWFFLGWTWVDNDD